MKRFKQKLSIKSFSLSILQKINSKVFSVYEICSPELDHYREICIEKSNMNSHQKLFPIFLLSPISARNAFRVLSKSKDIIYFFLLHFLVLPIYFGIPFLIEWTLNFSSPRTLILTSEWKFAHSLVLDDQSPNSSYSEQIQGTLPLCTPPSLNFSSPLNFSTLALILGYHCEHHSTVLLIASIGTSGSSFLSSLKTFLCIRSLSLRSGTSPPTRTAGLFL